MKKREEYELKLKEDSNASYSQEKVADLGDDDNEAIDHAYSQYIMNEA